MDEESRATSPYRKGTVFEYLSRQIAVLESLFGGQWFASASARTMQHPAYQRWSFCQELIRTCRISSLAQAVSLLQISLDNAILIECSGGSVPDITLGSFIGYGDEKVRHRLRSEFLNPRKFLDILAELSYASSHIGRHSITASQEEGMADYSVDLGSEFLPLVVDCKRLEANSVDARVATVIKKANKQIKRARRECYGLAVLYVSDRVILGLDPKDQAVENSVIPSEIERLKLICANALRSFNTSVSGVLLVWDQCEILGDPQTADRSLFFLMRRSVVVHHAHPRVRLPEPAPLYESGFTKHLWVTWQRR